LAEYDGTTRVNRTGVYSVPKAYIGDDRKATVTFILKYNSQSRGLSGDGNFLGPRKLVEQLLVVSERMVNTFFLIFACIKLGILSVFILLYLFSPTQKFLEYFILYGLMVSIDSFFVVDMFPEIIRLPAIQFSGFFTLQSIGSYCLWFLIESLLQIRVGFQRWFFYFFQFY
jgi:hypothetical protein